MIYIKIELWPFGNKEKRRSLGEAKIWNTGKGTPTTGEYKAEFKSAGEKPKVWKSSEVKGFPRKKLLVWDLLYRALYNAIRDRNRE